MTNSFVEIFVTKPYKALDTLYDMVPSQEKMNMDNSFVESTQQEMDREQDLKDQEVLDKDFSDPQDSEEYELNGSDSDDEVGIQMPITKIRVMMI